MTWLPIASGAWATPGGNNTFLGTIKTVGAWDAAIACTVSLSAYLTDPVHSCSVVERTPNLLLPTVIACNRSPGLSRKLFSDEAGL